MAIVKKVKKAQKGKTLSPTYNDVRGKGWDYFKTPTAKDSANYKKGFDKKVQGENLEQYPSPTGAEVRGYNEAAKKVKKQRSDGKVTKAKAGKQMLKRADGSVSQRGLWDNLRAAKGSGKKPTKAMLVQEKKIKAKTK
jgi:hypothetical protein